ncbi:MAG: alpha/beta hydrolase [SAR202 cluster bacterium]|jgi:alpha-beta hydrolase superfamily lysophospholipase|nr:alpha/beta hydrolase [SAR202 cluster bacterium]
MEIHHTEDNFETEGGLVLYEQSWRPDIEPKAAIIMVHGYAEHSGRYAHVAEHMVERGYTVHAFDLRNHGRSDGSKGLIKSIDSLVEDTGRRVARINQQQPSVPTFLLGHSTGGGIAALLAINGNLDVQGMILSGALIKLADNPPAPLRWLATIIGALLPRLPVKALDSGVISRDPSVVAAYDNDPLVYRGKTMARTAAELMAAGRRVQAGMEAITLPILVMHGAADVLIDPQGSVDLHETARSEDKTLKLYDGAYHEILNEPEKHQVMADIVDWMDARL